MIATLQDLGLISADNALSLESFSFTDSCPLFSAEVEDRLLAEHGFWPPREA